MESTCDDAWALEQTTFVEAGVEGRSEEDQAPPSQEMCRGLTAPEEAGDLPDAVPPDPPVPMLMTVQDGKPKQQ
eukprot:4071570-Amphidinium_carterae.1